MACLVNIMLQILFLSFCGALKLLTCPEMVLFAAIDVLGEQYKHGINSALKNTC